MSCFWQNAGIQIKLPDHDRNPGVARMTRSRPAIRVWKAGFFARTAPSFLNIIVVVLGLLALTTQSLVVQTHVHSLAVSSSGAQSGGPNGVDGNNPPPGKSGTVQCPLCQAFANSSQFTHSVALFSAPFLAYRSIYFAVHEAIPSFAAVSHSWRGRAPPL